MNAVLLDTSACIRLFGGDTPVRRAIAGADPVMVTVFTLGELYAGYRGGTKFQQNVDMLHRFLAQSQAHVPEATVKTAEIFGSIMSGLRRAGTPLPVNDVWIAAQAMEHGAVVISYDRHFLKVPGLRVWPRLEFGT